MTLDLTVATIQDVLYGEKEHERYIVAHMKKIGEDEIKERWGVTLMDKQYCENFEGIVEISKTQQEKVISVKTFKITKQ